MKIKRIELEGRAGRVTIERDGCNVKIVSTIDDPGNPYHTTKWEITSNQMDIEGTNNLWNLAERIQRRCDGVRGTNGDVQGYYSELQRFAD